MHSPWQLNLYVELLAGVPLYVSVMLPVVAVFSPVTLATAPAPHLANKNRRQRPGIREINRNGRIRRGCSASGY